MKGEWNNWFSLIWFTRENREENGVGVFLPGPPKFFSKAPFVSAENVFRKTFSAFAGVCCNVKQKSNWKSFLLTVKSRRKKRKTVYGNFSKTKHARSSSSWPPSLHSSSRPPSLLSALDLTLYSLLSAVPSHCSLPSRSSEPLPATSPSRATPSLPSLHRSTSPTINAHPSDLHLSRIGSDLIKIRSWSDQIDWSKSDLIWSDQIWSDLIYIYIYLGIVDFFFGWVWVLILCIDWFWVYILIIVACIQFGI